MGPRADGTALGMALALALSGAQAASLADTVAERASLKGLTAFRVLVEQLGPTLERDGVLNRDVLQADVETRLAKAGIAVSKEAPAVLYATVALVCDPQNCAFNAALEVQQRVRLEHRPQARRLTAPTWRTSVTGLVARRPDLVRQNLREQVDQFIAAYRAANPAK
jgi:hypothetical protein